MAFQITGSKRRKYEMPAPSFGGGGGSNSLDVFIAKQIYDQEQEKQKADAAKAAGGVPTEIRADGTTFSMPAARTSTADAQNQLTRLNQIKSIVKGVQDLGNTLPTDFLSASKGTLGAKYAYGRFGSSQHKAYTDSLPTAAVGTYRAVTGDNRLSDADAASRAMPLFWQTMEPENVREGKNSFINFLLDEAEKNLLPGEPTNDMESMVRWQSFVNSSKEKFIKAQQASDGMIRVKNIVSGRTGKIPSANFDPKKYERI